MSNDQKKRNNNFNFIIITLIFFAGLGIFQFFMFRNLQLNFQVLKGDIKFEIYEDYTVDFITNVDIRAENERDFNTLLEGFQTSDAEKLQHFQEELNKLEEQIPRDFVVLSYESKVNSNFPIINLHESVKVKGFVFKKDDGNVEFSLPNQFLSGPNQRVTVEIVYPESWEIISVDPTPTYIEQNLIGYTYTGTFGYPSIEFKE
ncbi:hypothetical protein PW5551_08860 [Petrotoga sp. 9PW.55.5.1]|uniref:DUF4897 domain-containing protein n=1 Tax=Petrotoga sp. 9PW.55.5.1 TaxID=1308979 RepID=UPI000DC50D5A|nr:DUF4897 domain-containing protein [Petrotoga sp. 9PW.55.5.1]RAO98584.1 hypothetical protein PW5551_08860 [Petrotoga sp. 9PW.55.5.1]